MNTSLPNLMWPSADVKVRLHNNTDEIYDHLRNRWVRLTPEEWVRQHFLNHLVNDLGYAPSMIAIEKTVTVNRMPKRFDALVHVASRPMILVECKAPHVKLTEDVFHQACRYNTEIGTPLTVLTNGLAEIIAHIDFKSGHVGYLREIPHRTSW